MVQDDNVRSLIQVMIMAKEIISADKFNEFLSECAGNEALFVVGTDTTRKFVAQFCDKYKIDPRGKTFDLTPPSGFDTQRWSNDTAGFQAKVVIGGVTDGGKLQGGYGGERCTRGS